MKFASSVKFEVQVQPKSLFATQVDLVSTRKNKQAAVPDGDAWKLIVRDADRIEAVGEVRGGCPVKIKTKIKKCISES